MNTLRSSSRWAPDNRKPVALGAFKIDRIEHAAEHCGMDGLALSDHLFDFDPNLSSQFQILKDLADIG